MNLKANHYVMITVGLVEFLHYDYQTVVVISFVLTNGLAHIAKGIVLHCISCFLMDVCV